MAGVNKVFLIGNLGRDPEVSYSQSGTAICRFTIAIGERKKDGDQWVEHTEWVRIVCFGKTAENVGQYLAKGSQCCVDGRMQTTKYTDKEGIEKYSTDVIANNITFLGSAAQGSQNGSSDSASPMGGGRGQPRQQGQQGQRGQPRQQGQQGQRGQQGQQGQRGQQGQQGQPDGFYDDDLPF